MGCEVCKIKPAKAIVELENGRTLVCATCVAKLQADHQAKKAQSKDSTLKNSNNSTESSSMIKKKVCDRCKINKREAKVVLANGETTVVCKQCVVALSQEMKAQMKQQKAKSLPPSSPAQSTSSKTLSQSQEKPKSNTVTNNNSNSNNSQSAPTVK